MMDKYVKYLNKLTGVKWNCDNYYIHTSFILKESLNNQKSVLSILESNNIKYSQSSYGSSIFIKPHYIISIIRDNKINDILG